ncbi:MAG TPA: hypothetical protein VLH15_09910 [Dehalococcoidales bacterium]|nr:hypothetical protein [Dehalococcoidales bacterium]
MLNKYRRIIPLPFFNNLQWLIVEQPVRSQEWYQSAVRRRDSRCICAPARKN